MSEIYVDTVKMRECGNEILSLVEELKLTMQTMFSRIENMPTQTKEWIGDSSQYYVTLATHDKIQYMNHANDLYKYGKYLLDCADYFEKTSQSVRRN